MKVKITKATGYDPYSVGDTFTVVDVNVAAKILEKAALFIEDHLGHIFKVEHGCYEIIQPPFTHTT